METVYYTITGLGGLKKINVPKNSTEEKIRSAIYDAHFPVSESAYFEITILNN